MQDRDYYLFRREGKIAVYSPKIGGSKYTLSGRLNLSSGWLFPTSEETAKFLFDQCGKERYRPNLVYDVPQEHKSNGKNLDLKVLRAIRESIRSIHDEVEKKARVRQKIMPREKRSSGERIIRIRRGQKISIS
ncbi:MAG: hypothetical protein AABW58_04820 [Nanoarchaeota archaeon]